ncbi:MAG: hypothetical protein IKY66_03405 [Bacteroidales bacterium]|nr:hypothetical protein [Bacteroidales bacterium]
MKFNSQICTTREQSERLLSLGLKKETADMIHVDYGGRNYMIRPYDWLPTSEADMEKYIPAWSLHRLWEMAAISQVGLGAVGEIAKLYDLVINNIESLILIGSFKKEYLED